MNNIEQSLKELQGDIIRLSELLNNLETRCCQIEYDVERILSSQVFCSHTNTSTEYSWDGENETPYEICEDCGKTL